MIFLSGKDGFISHFLKGHSHTQGCKEVLCFLKWLWFSPHSVLSVHLLELFNHSQSVSWENLPASSQWTAAPCCPGCKGKVLNSLFLLNHFICFKDTEQSWSYSMRTRLNSQVLSSKGCKHWKSYPTRVPKETMQFFPRKIENRGWLWVLEIDFQSQRDAEN